MYHHTKFGHKRFSDSGDIIQTIIKPSNVSNLCCDLDLGYNNLICSQDSLAFDDVPPQKFGLQKDQQIGRHSKNNHILIR